MYLVLILCFSKEQGKRTARLFRDLEIEVFLTVGKEKNIRTGLCGFVKTNLHLLVNEILFLMRI